MLGLKYPYGNLPVGTPWELAVLDVQLWHWNWAGASLDPVNFQAPFLWAELEQIRWLGSGLDQFLGLALKLLEV